jgi:hypothetical protein
MKWSPIALVLIASLAVPCTAQEPKEKSKASNARESRTTIRLSPGELSATPEMWFYEQALRQYQDPKTAVRQKAEFRVAERQRRLAALKWYGLSNARPRMGSDFVHGDPVASWTSGHTYYPNRWTSAGYGTLVVRPAAPAAPERPAYLTVP